MPFLNCSKGFDLCKPLHNPLVLPGTYSDSFQIPNHECIEVAVFHEHRFAFSFWSKWLKNFNYEDIKGIRPALITLDHHSDLCPPDLPGLDHLNINDFSSFEKESDIALFSWAKLNSLNDSHILSAAYLNLISDIYVICDETNIDPTDTSFIDKFGLHHSIECFPSIDNFLANKSNNPEQIYFDIDLDFFTKTCNDNDNDIELIPDKDIINNLNPNSELMKFILPRTHGITIALEPSHCGGLRNSHHLYKIVEQSLFGKPLNFRY